jgi:hypothetical protein
MHLKIKLAGIYKIQIGEYYYIGMSVDIFSRWSSHWTDYKMGKHTSIKTATPVEEWQFSILERVSITDFKKETGLKGKKLEDVFRTFLLKKEKDWMKKFSRNFAMNANNRSFS